MRAKLMLVAVIVVGATASASGARAADANDSAKSAPGNTRQSMHGKSAQKGDMMHVGGMMDGMMHGGGMMDRCAQMMGGPTSAHLPPGNEKLELQMQAEIMRKTGEILAKYAERLGDEPKRTP